MRAISFPLDQNAGNFLLVSNSLKQFSEQGLPVRQLISGLTFLEMTSYSSSSLSMIIFFFILQMLKGSMILLQTVPIYSDSIAMDCHKIIEALKKGEVVSQRALREVCKRFAEILVEESNVIRLQSPINIIGDVHGQFFDVLKIFKLGGELPSSKYLFLGDYVDRGYNSLQTIMLLACYKILYPDRIYLLRGNHESRQISSMYGFYEQTQKKYGTTSVWKIFNEVFDCLPLAAVVNRSYFCLHGGLSPDIHTVEEIEDFDRICEIPTSGAFGDLVWSDPEQIQNWAIGSRGVGWLFGWRAVSEFIQHNWLKMIVRSHQLVQKGYQQWFKAKNLVTVWSAPNYCYRCGNVASIMKVGEDGNHTYEIFGQDERSSQSVHYNKLIPYFL